MNCFQAVTKTMNMKILFVCLANICRSPIAEGILRRDIKKHNLDVEVESAGFESYHINDNPDSRAVNVAQKNGIDISNYKCRLFVVEDFERFDVIYVMDMANFREVGYFARNDKDMEKVKFLMSVVTNKNESIPNPYFGDTEGFDKTFEMLEKACTKIVSKIKNTEPL